jgi:hypothetical protein
MKNKFQSMRLNIVLALAGLYGLINGIKTGQTWRIILGGIGFFIFCSFGILLLYRFRKDKQASNK